MEEKSLYDELINRIVQKIKQECSNEARKDFDEWAESITEKISEKEKDYPRFNLSLNKTEIDEMKKDGIINDEYIINGKIFESDNKRSPLEKLLLGILWKNGDYKKEKHIINGICYEEASDPKELNTINDRFVFWNFGRYMKNKNRPIFDQHTKRAYLNLFKHKDTYEDYIMWFEKFISDFKENEEDASYYLDSILFLYGKHIKKSKKIIRET